ncbi:MAG TPA: YciI family protein [Candidatus Dormibacteraeota bacterium]
MIMTFGSAEVGLATMGKEWMLEMIQFMHRLDDDLRKSGELVSEAGLADGSQAKTVIFQNGIPVATDGPYAESKESLVGFWIVDVENEARAIEIASRIVAYVKSPIEVRRVMDAPPEF